MIDDFDLIDWHEDEPRWHEREGFRAAVICTFLIGFGVVVTVGILQSWGW